MSIESFLGRSRLPSSFRCCFYLIFFSQCVQHIIEPNRSIAICNVSWARTIDSTFSERKMLPRLFVMNSWCQYVHRKTTVIIGHPVPWSGCPRFRINFPQVTADTSIWSTVWAIYRTLCECRLWLSPLNVSSNTQPGVFLKIKTLNISQSGLTASCCRGFFVHSGPTFPVSLVIGRRDTSVFLERRHGAMPCSTRG